MQQRVERKLVAILAADVVGYSRLTGVDEEGTLARLRALRQELIDPAIAGHHGRIVKTTGDGMLVEFASAVDAARCAIEVQRAMVPRNAGQSPERRIEFRIGINVGDVVVDGSDLLGDGVNIAARLEAIAEPGGICLSEDAFRQVAGKVDAAFDEMGEQALKNIARPVRVYSADLAAGAATRSGSRPALALPDKPSIAVLAFTNMSGDPEQEYFADGVVEDIITGLSRIKWLFVIARNSSFTYKGATVTVKQVGRELGVRYVLEGSIRKAGNRVRITGQLVEAETGVHLWAERYDRAIDDIFALQDEITLSVVGAIEPRLRAAEIERVKRKRPENLDAYDLWLKAQPYIATAMPQDAAPAIPLLERALEFEPGYAAGHASLAWCYHLRFGRGGLREDDRVSALHHARAALTYGADDANSLAMAGFVIWMEERDTVTAQNLFERALALSASNNFALSCSSVTLAWMGHTGLAIERARQALRLSPYGVMTFLPNCGLANALISLGQYEAAAAAARAAIEANPRFSIPHLYVAAAMVGLGRLNEAKTAAHRAVELDPLLTIRSLGVTVGHEPAVYARFVEAWRAAGVPE
ncbi:MAG TPA: adenylate/guanylate cyclase domain-containing protein [Candidatus Cybelea sp.]|nr:adenylate/guanylate cyclase domain-containing protein [Candidatus Cybelea sp.]